MIQIADSCLKVSLRKNYKLIDKEGLDSSSSNPSFYEELSKKINTSCREYVASIKREVKEIEELEYKKFQERQKITQSGAFISQTKLHNGEYEIIVKAPTGNKTFISSTPINESEASKPGTELSITFEPNTSVSKANYPLRAKSIAILSVAKIGVQ